MTVTIEEPSLFERMAKLTRETPTPLLDRTFGEERGTYYVIRTDMNGPTIDKKRHEHPSRVKAEVEARRLALTHPGVEFAVVKKKTAYKAELPAPPPPPPPPAYNPKVGDICFYRNERSSLNDQVVVVTGWEGERPIITGLNHLRNVIHKKARPEHLELIEVDRGNLFGSTP